MKKTSRRKFIGQAGLLSCLPMLAIQACSPMAQPLEDVFIHQVYFWLKEPGDAEARRHLIEGLKTLTRIRTVRKYHIGVPAGTQRTVVDGSYDVSWLVIFDDKASQDAYQEDPIHVRFVEEYGHLWQRVLVYDSVDA